MQQQRRETATGTGKLPALAPLANPYVPYQTDDPEIYDNSLGLVRGTLYPGLDLPFMNMVNQEALKQTELVPLQELCFAIQELALYLDTHREDAKALALYRRYQQMYQEQRNAYAQKCGPLSHSEAVEDDSYRWLDDPWPWEYGVNKEG